jgi:hypothetical protein
MKKILTMLVISLLVLSMMFFAPLTFATSAKIWTDKPNYGPGETVTIFGSGFLASAEVTITIERPNKWLDTVYAVTDDVGGFISTYTLDGIEGTYTVTATDGTNTATTTFIDALTYTPSRYPAAGSASVAAGSSVSFTLTLSDTVPSGVAPLTYTRKSLIAKAGYIHMDDAWVTTVPYSFTKPKGDFSLDVTVTITVPSSAATGDYAAILKYTPREGDGCEIYITVTPPPPPPAATISGVKFNDRNADGVRDIIGEEGLKGWTIELWKLGTCVQTTTTGDAGDYIFTVTTAGTYKVMEVLLTGWRQTAPPAPGYYEFSVSLGDTITGKDFGNKKQYYLTVTDNIGGLSDVSTQSGWYDECTYVDLTAPAYVPVAEGIHYRFDVWDVEVPVHMDADHTATAHYIEQFYLTVVSAYDTPSGEGWYDQCTYAYADLATGTVDIVLGSVRAIFTGWSSDASGTGLISDPIHMNGPKTAIANWKIQYYLTVVTDPSDLPPIPGADWYDECTWVELTAPTYQPSEAGVGGVRYKFSYWDVDGTSQGMGVNPIDIHMNAPHTATAYYIVQYYLTITTSPGGVNTPSGEDWYDGATYASISTDEYVDIVPSSSRYRFNGWTTTDMSEITDPSATSTTVLMDKAKTVTADYVIQYYLTVKTDPEGLVTISGEGWYDEGTDVTLTAPTVTCHLFVYWDVDGTNTEGNPITVHMDAAHTATAHYWPCLEYEQFVTDSSFNVITRFDTVWTPKDMKKTTFKLASTNPGQFYLNIKITNTWPANTGTITASYTLDPDFIIHPIQGDPIQVWTGYGITGTRIPATVTYGASGTVTTSGIAPGQTVYITIHMEYGPAREYFDKATMLAWKLHHASNTFNCGYTVTVPGPFPFVITNTSSTTITDPIVVLGLED